MSAFSFGDIFGGLNYGGGINMYGTPGPGWASLRLPMEIPVDTKSPAPKAGAITATPTQSGYLTAGSTPYLQGYARAPLGCPATWRLMDCTPTLALAKFLVIGPILTASRAFEANPGPNGTKRKTPPIGDGVQSDPLDQRAEWFCQWMDAKLYELIRQSCDALSMGNAPFECVLDVKDGRWFVSRFKPLLPEWTQILVYPGGDFAGLRHGASELLGLRAFNHANDPLCDNWYGRSRHDNVREEWWEKLNAKVKSAELDQKASGRQGYIMGPPGTGRKDAKGNPEDGSDAAKSIALSLANGGTPYMPKFLLGPPDESQLSNPDYVRAYAEMAKLTAFEIETVDWGNTGPHQQAMMGKFGYLDKELLRGWHRPEREALEASSGGIGQSDAADHGDIGIIDCDLVHRAICNSLNAGPIDGLLKENWGDDAAGTVILKPSPIQDATKQQFKAFLQSLMSNPQNSTDLYKKTDKEKLLVSLDLPVRDDVDVNEDPEPVAPPAAPPKPGQDDNEKDKPNGKGKSLLAELSRAFDESDDLLTLSEDELSGGEWRTINGAHVYMKDGVAAAGPKGVVDKINGKKKAIQTPRHLIGKTAAEVESHGKNKEPHLNGYHRVDRDAAGNYAGTQDEHGNVSHVQEHADRLKKYKPQPGWSNAHLNDDPEAKIQVKAKDAAGRSASIRTGKSAVESDAKKWERNDRFHIAAPSIRERMKADLTGPHGEEAAVSMLMDKTGFRVGSNVDTKARVKAYGASTLNASHVRVEGSKTHFDFIAKEGIRQQHTIDDPELAEIMGPRIAKGGNLFGTTDKKSGQYLKTISGQDFKNKDFRTELGTETARKAMQGMAKPDTIAALKKARMVVATAVAARLGNKPKQSLEDYINPKVWKSWNLSAANGEQLAAMKQHHALNPSMSENEAHSDWIKNNAKAFREHFDKETRIKKPRE